MTLLRFVHAADLHLDSPFKGLRDAAPEGISGEISNATFRTYDNIIDLCIGERVAALLVAGDVYDGAERSLRAQRKFIEGLERLDEQGIRSFVCHGNHDPLDGWEARLAYPALCHRFAREWEHVPVFPEDPARAVVHGISYPKSDVRDNLALGLGNVTPAGFSIGLLHANVGSDTATSRTRPVRWMTCGKQGLITGRWGTSTRGASSTSATLLSHTRAIRRVATPTSWARAACIWLRWMTAAMRTWSFARSISFAGSAFPWTLVRSNRSRVCWTRCTGRWRTCWIALTGARWSRGFP